MSGGSKQTTQVSDNQPWSAAQPNLKAGLGEAKNLFDSGVGSQVYSGSTVVPFADQTTKGMQQMQGQADMAQGGLNNAFGATSQLASSGFNAPQMASMRNMAKTAIGNDVFGSNPEFQNILKKSQDDASNAVNLNASAAGRYGSGTHQGVMADSIGDLTSNMLSQEYSRQLGRKDNATSQLFQAGQAGVGNQLGATSALGNAYQNTLAPSQTNMQIGSMYEDLYGRQLNDKLRIFNETQNRPWENLARFQAANSGSGQYGTSTTTAQQPGQSPFATGLGALSLLSGLGG